MSQSVAIVSPSSLESWSWVTPWTTGIGGSETSHIEMCEGLKKAGYDVHSFSPMTGESISLAGVINRGIEDFDPKNYSIVIVYRHAATLDYPKIEGQKIWFVAQDVSYPDLADERIERIDRYLCLCATHAAYTQSTYPALRGKTYISSNGVRSAFVENMELSGGATNPVTGVAVKIGPRVPRRMLYASSPDRGLKLILEQWFRIKEKVPEAELHVAYGFDNMEKIVKAMGGGDWRAGYQRELERLLEQPGIKFTGRLNQLELYKEWFEAGIWFYPSDWAETSCITVMDAMATGCWPVTNNLWAVGEHMRRIGEGDLFFGIPQKSALVRSYMMEKVCERLNGGVKSGPRDMMMGKARAVFDWERVVDQWQRWIEEDFSK